MPPVGFDPSIPASDRKNILALDHPATGIRHALFRITKSNSKF
jgi:hypothetical protein